MTPLSNGVHTMKAQDFAMASVVAATFVYVGLIVGGILWMFESFLSIITK